ncbi:MAG: hypothetical protein MJ147_00050 [Clostridia bacterium]|nr:hypothetical protein [Clostridia bacterium]
MNLTVKQKQSQNGFLGGPKMAKLLFDKNNIEYEIYIEQCGIRTITIKSNSEIVYEDLLEVYYSLETLLMLFDGQFYPIVSVFEDDVEVTCSWIKRTLPSYNSADFMIGTNNTLIDFSNSLCPHILNKWSDLHNSLDLIHKMVLYCLSSVKMPKDMQFAFMIEAFLGICELVNAKKSDFQLPKVPNKESKLKHYFIAIINRYGNDIFEKEIELNEDEFAQILVNSRNRIAHISSKQGRVFLDGGESVMYLKKLSLLYRVVIFDLLGLDYNLYKGKIIKIVNQINEHEITQRFFKKLM